MKDLVLHIGFGKTGTSSIQEFLLRNEAFLSESRYKYISTMGLGNNHTYPLLKLCSTTIDTYGSHFIESVEKNSTINVENYMSEFIQQLNAVDGLVHILSSEMILNLDSLSLVLLKNELNKIYDRIRVAVCYRNPFDLLLAYNYQYFKEGVSYETLNKYPILFSQYERIENFKAIYCNNNYSYNFYLYDAADSIVNFVEKILYIPKANMDKLDINIRENVSDNRAWKSYCRAAGLNNTKGFYMEKHVNALFDAIDLFDRHQMSTKYLLSF